MYLDAGIWNVLSEENGEMGLTQVGGLEPLAVCLIQPRSNNFEGHFDALAATEGKGTTWAEEIARYKREGLARIAGRAPEPADSAHVSDYEHTTSRAGRR